VVTPTITPASNAYASPQSVTIATTTSGATLTYTTDSTDPTASSPAYSGPVTVSDTRTIKTRAFKSGWTPSDPAAASYWISAGTVAAPALSPAAGTYAAQTVVRLSSSTSGATIRFTLAGTEPGLASPIYGAPLLLGATTTIKARAFLAGYTASGTAAGTYTIDPAGQTARPTVTPTDTWFPTAQTALAAAPAGATVRYTTDGTDPTETSIVFPGAGLAIDRSQLLKVRAWQTGSTASAVERGAFAITGAIAAGFLHSLALTPDGIVRAWGQGTEGQLGQGTVLNSSSPLVALTDAVAIAAGHRLSLAIKRDHTLWSWGRVIADQLTPVQVPGLSNVCAAAGGYTHALALTCTGEVWAWGTNASGELGDGTTTQRATPVRVPGLSGVTSIAAGEGFSLAVQVDAAGHGFVWAWGANAQGQFGDGSTTGRSIPVRITTLDGAVQVAAGQAFGLARMADGSVRAWGANEAGQLGNGSTVSSLTPMVVPTLAGIRTISAGTMHGLAVDRDGRAWGWGYNDQRQLGVDPEWIAGLGGMLAPQLLTKVPATLALAGGWSHTLAVRADGTLWAAGSGYATGSAAPAGPFVAVSGVTFGDQSALLADPDSDGLPTWRELSRGTDPLNADSNGNGLTDGIELGTPWAGADVDEDGDGLASVRELAQGTDPFVADTDGDGVADNLDAFPLDATRTQAPTPQPGDTTPPTITLTEPTNAVPRPPLD
jgi:hypothetical protein